MQNCHYFNGLTLLVTHYNRSESLRRLLKSFKDGNYAFEHIIVSDDGSQPEHIEQLTEIQKEFGVQLLQSAQNRGLGNNINKGQDAVRTPFTLYVQEDFIPKELFFEKLQNAVLFLNERPEIDIVRFYAYFKYPTLKPYKNGFSEMKFSSRNILSGYKRFYMYSDHPHIRRSSFFDRFGRYTEGVKGDVTEYRMMMSFLKNKGRALFYEDFKGLFDQVNSAQEPSTMKRNFWRESNSLPVQILRHLYRHVRFNFDLHF
ncbi:glycosyltransferase family 2 protein [Desertivirga xinjiangensis]|uniref:glycosyltransferase family 2 protein n=1 Tax=Desertivirga xinjiangensis TaxID=539206 RepID=UPI00210EDF03|nr:glycosyltransferase family 2 protein [Pedobacter xinjiangensis]